MLGGVGHASAVVLQKPLFQVLGDADVVVAVIFGLENVNVVEI